MILLSDNSVCGFYHLSARWKHKLHKWYSGFRQKKLKVHKKSNISYWYSSINAYYSDTL